MPVDRKDRKDRNDAFLAAYDALLDRWPQPVDRVDVPTPHGRTRVNVCGKEDGPPLLLIPGGMVPSVQWFANAPALGAACRLYAVDTLGQPGRSEYPLPSAPRTPADLMSWLDALLDGLELPSAHIASHSYGSWLALSYALHAPARVRSLTLLDPSECFTGMSPSYRLHAVPLILRPSAARLRSFAAWETRGRALDPQWQEVWGLGLESGLLGRPVLPKRPTPGQLRACKVPTLVLLAEHSRQHAAATVAARARDLLPEATVEILPGAAHHDIPTEHAAAIDRQVLRHLAG